MSTQMHYQNGGIISKQLNEGFTLIELMVTLIIASILLMVAVPSFQDATLGSKLSSYANTFVVTVNQARGEAIKRNAEIKLCVSDDGTACDTGDWEQGWLLFRDIDDDGTVDTNDIVLLKQSTFPQGIKVIETSDVDLIRFQPTGVGVTQVELKFCRANPSVGKQERVVSVSTTGRASVAQTTSGTCS